MKKMIIVVLLIGLVVGGMWFVNENSSDFRKEIGGRIVSIDLSDGFSFDVHKRSFMDDAFEAVGDFVDDGMTFIEDTIDTVTGN